MTEEEHWEEIWRKADAEIDAAYWRFCRCARALPPILQCPDAHRRRNEAEQYLNAIRTPVPGTNMDKIKVGDVLYRQNILNGVASFEVLKVGRRYVTLSTLDGPIKVDMQTMRDEQSRLYVRHPGEFESRKNHYKRYCKLVERLRVFTSGLAAVNITPQQIDELNATLDRMPKRE
ncbi:MAG: beta barrel domain-containing protein [Giesbergeria sp.]